MGAKILNLGDKSKQKQEKSLIFIKDVRKKPFIWDFFAIFARPFVEMFFINWDRQNQFKQIIYSRK